MSRWPQKAIQECETEWSDNQKLVKLKDRLTGDVKDGYRDICVNVEVRSSSNYSIVHPCVYRPSVNDFLPSRLRGLVQVN